MKPGKELTVITPRRRWLELRLADIWRYRDLVLLFARRDFVTVYKQTVLGPFWFVLQPLASTAIFTVVFGYIVGVTTGEIPRALFYLSGVVLWNFFSSCLTRSSDTLVANASLFGKVYFPRLTVPLSVGLVNSLTFLVQFVIFAGFAGYFALQGAPLRISAQIWTLPLVVLQVGCLGLASGILVSALTTKYRDLAFMTGFAVQLWMYATPIVYPLSLVPEGWRPVYLLNPMAVAVGSFRGLFWAGAAPPAFWIGVSWIETLLSLVLALVLFNWVEKTFVDTV
ncbi:MAG: ABC transporter permease [Deltaproteobacteria bacterium]|nr:MAG: ABC transporter permease [Deltaproteobacteria bacterium]